MMIGIDYRQAYLKSDDEDSEHSLELSSVTSPPPQQQLERGGSLRSLGGSLRKLERKGSFRLSMHKSESSLRSSSRRSIFSDDDDDRSVSSISSCSTSNWANMSVSDLAMSVASFSASFRGVVGGGNSSKDLGTLETEEAVQKLLDQIQDRINSRRDRQKEYKKRRDSCLELALARFEAGSSNNASLVSMRRVDKLRDGLNRVKDAEIQLRDLHSQIDVELQKAKMITDDGDPVLVDLDLETLRASARKIEEDLNAKPFVPKTDDQLIAELKKLSPSANDPKNKKIKKPRKLRGGRRWTKSHKTLQG